MKVLHKEFWVEINVTDQSGIFSIIIPKDGSSMQIITEDDVAFIEFDVDGLALIRDTISAIINEIGKNNN